MSLEYCFLLSRIKTSNCRKAFDNATRTLCLTSNPFRALVYIIASVKISVLLRCFCERD